MSWYKQHRSFSENPFNKPVIDRCINCGDQAEVQASGQVKELYPQLVEIWQQTQTAMQDWLSEISV